MAPIYRRHEDGNYTMFDKDLGLESTIGRASPVVAELSAEEYEKARADEKEKREALVAESVAEFTAKRDANTKSAAAKLEALGLTEDEIAAITGRAAEVRS